MTADVLLSHKMANSRPFPVCRSIDSSRSSDWLQKSAAARSDVFQEDQEQMCFSATVGFSFQTPL